MNAKILIAGVAVAAMVCGAASARTHAKHHHASGGVSYAAPSQPIPYSQLDAYVKAAPKQRSAMMSGGAMASAGAPAETPAATIDMPAAPSQPAVNAPAFYGAVWAGRRTCTRHARGDGVQRRPTPANAGATAHYLRASGYAAGTSTASGSTTSPANLA